MNSKIYLAAAFALALAACTNENEPITPADGEVAARIVADINNMATRASGDAWSPNDEIGISTVPGTKTSYTNFPYKYDGTTFKPSGATIYFQSPDEVTFNAYYPFKGTSGTSAGIITATTDAEAQRNLPAIDFLFAEGAKADKTNPTVEFTDKTKNNGEDNSFHHRMSQISIKFTEGDDIAFSGGKLQSYTLKGLVLKGTFNTETGFTKVTDGEQVADLTIRPENVSVDNKVFDTAPVILFPQTPAYAKDGTPVAGKIGLEVTVEGETYHATLTIPGGKIALDAGNHYTFPVTVKKTGLSVGTAQISDWEPVNGEPTDATM